MKKQFLIGALAVLMFSCASDKQKGLEEARFLLDKGEFDAAIEQVQPIYEADPNNNEAKFIYASALIGNFALSPKPGCQATDTGYLGVLACLLDDKDEDDSNGLRTFGRIAPDDDSENASIKLAVNLLISIDEFSEITPRIDVALQRLVARSFSLSTTFKTVEANSPNLECNAGGAGVDEVPDDFASSNILQAEAANFRENLEGIEADAKIVGFEGSFNLVGRANAILDDLDNTGLNNTQAVRLIFESAYNSPDQQVCN
ncbi:MAG: hypothetical protein IT286_02510 [Proteobacteria bacterium]|nr:hypothetical protein [Pseudomonadota bacterium]